MAESPRSSPAPEGSPYDWRVALWDFLPALLIDGGCYIAFFVLALLVNDAGGDALAVALVLGIYTILYAVLAPLLGKASDRLGRRRSLLIGGALGAAAPFLGASAIRLGYVGPEARWLDMPTLAYGVVVLLAVSNGFLWPAFQARIGDRERDPLRLARAIRVFNLGWTTGKASGFLVGGLLYAWSPVGCLYGASLAGLGVFLVFLLDRRPASSGARGAAEIDPSARPQAIKRAFLVSSLGVNLVLWGSVATLTSLAPKLLGGLVGLDVRRQGLVLGLALAAQGAGFFCFGDNRRWAYRGSWLLAPLPLAGLGLVALWFAQGLGLAVLAAVLIGLAQALTYGASVFYSLDFDTHRGLRMGIHEANLALGGGLPILGGWLADLSGNLRAPLGLMLGLGAAAALLSVALLVRARSANAP